MLTGWYPGGNLRSVSSPAHTRTHWQSAILRWMNMNIYISEECLLHMKKKCIFIDIVCFNTCTSSAACVSLVRCEGLTCDSEVEGFKQEINICPQSYSFPVTPSFMFSGEKREEKKYPPKDKDVVGGITGDPTTTSLLIRLHFVFTSTVLLFVILPWTTSSDLAF